MDLAAGATPAEKLKVIQAACEKGDDRAAKVFQSIGVCLGYTLAHYADFYELRHVLLLGRVVSGKGGDLLMERARTVLKNEFSELNGRLTLHLPENESERRVGQAIAAASLPAVNG
jgi:predicted NBD/HSP70 family sugar kinase